MLSDKKTWWTMNTESNLPHNYATNVNRLSTPLPGICIEVKLDQIEIILKFFS